MIYCLNSNCSSPENPKNNKYCQKCGNSLILRNHYRPVKLLGGGGFGQVYLAEDIDRLNEFCVIKKFESNVQENEALQKAKELFEQEAKQLQKLGEHPQIPQLYAYFQEQGQFYIIQQYIEGDTLEQELKKQGVFNEEKITSLLKELLNILKFLHQNNTIHRDIKPANIIRRSQTVTEQGSLVLIDLGIAKQVNKTTIKTGTRIGTFGYMPMEQMQEGKVSPASDLYSLGATCFYLLSGVDPWELWKIKGYNWTKEWQNEIKQPLSKKIVQILDKLLQVEDKDRYQSAQEVLDDLEPYQTKVLINPAQPSPNVAQNIPRSKALALTFGAIITLGIGSIYWKQTHPINLAKDSPQPTSPTTVSEKKQETPPITSPTTVSEKKQETPPITSPTTVSEKKQETSPITSPTTVSEKKQETPPITPPTTVSEKKQETPPITSPQPTFNNTSSRPNAHAFPHSYIGNKGKYTVDYEAGTYQGCFNGECVFLGPNKRVSISSWKNGDSIYSIKNGEVVVYQNGRIIFQDSFISIATP